MAEEALLFKDKGTYIVLNMVTRMIERRAWEQLPPGLLKDFGDLLISDPYGSEHPEDSERWLSILEQAREMKWELYCLMMITRFAGTRIVDGGAYWKLEPIYHKDDKRAWWTEQRWQDYRREVLMLWANELRELLLKNGR